MGKKWVIMIIIIILIVGLCVAENLYIQSSFSYLLEELDEIELVLSSDEENVDKPENIELLDDLHTKWQKRSEVLKMIVWHTGVKDIEVNMSRIKSYVEENNYEEAIVELHQLQDFCNHYKNDFTITFQNIF